MGQPGLGPKAQDSTTADRIRNGLFLMRKRAFLVCSSGPCWKRGRAKSSPAPGEGGYIGALRTVSNPREILAGSQHRSLPYIKAGKGNFGLAPRKGCTVTRTTTLFGLPVKT